MVAQRNEIIANCVHHVDSAGAFGRTDVNSALAEVSCVNQNHFCSGYFIVCLQSRHGSIAFQCPVHVIAVQNDRLAAEITVVHLCIGSIVISC